MYMVPWIPRNDHDLVLLLDRVRVCLMLFLVQNNNSNMSLKMQLSDAFRTNDAYVHVSAIFDHTHTSPSNSTHMWSRVCNTRSATCECVMKNHRPRKQQQQPRQPSMWMASRQSRNVRSGQVIGIHLACALAL